MSRTLLKSSGLVAGMTLISRLLGFIRDVIVAQIFGATAAVDAFYIAFKIPNFMRGLFAEGSFSQAFVPILADYRKTRSLEEVQNFLQSMAGSLCLLLAGVTLMGVVGADGLAHIFAVGLDSERLQLAGRFLRITFPYLMLISLTAFNSAILNSYGQFWAPALTPALLNTCLIISALGLTDYFAVPVEAQVWGVLVAGFVQLGFQLIFVQRLGLLCWPRLDWRESGVARVLKLMLSTLFSASIGQLSLLLNTIFASFLEVGSVSWLYYADRLAYFPLGVFGVALATVLLPQLSRQHVAKFPQAFMHTLDWGLRYNLLFSLPATVALLLLSGPLITSLFYYGSFTVHDVTMTQSIVLVYAIGLPAFMMNKLLLIAFYAQQDMRTPMKLGMIVLLANVFLNTLFILPLKQVGLALASSLTAWLNTILLFKNLCHLRGYRQPMGRWLLFSLRLLGANALLALFLYWATAALSSWLHWRAWQRCWYMGLLGSVSLGIYAVGLLLCGFRVADFWVKPYAVDP